MGFCRKIDSIRLKVKYLLKPLKTRKFSAKYFFVEKKRVLRAFSCFEVPSVLTHFNGYDLVSVTTPSYTERKEMTIFFVIILFKSTLGTSKMM